MVLLKEGIPLVPTNGERPWPFGGRPAPAGQADPNGPDGQGGGARPGAPKKQAPGSLSFVPSAAGLVLAGEVIRDIAFGKVR